MPLYSFEGTLLVDNGKLAISEDCCCANESGECFPTGCSVSGKCECCCCGIDYLDVTFGGIGPGDPPGDCEDDEACDDCSMFNGTWRVFDDPVLGSCFGTAGIPATGCIGEFCQVTAGLVFDIDCADVAGDEIRCGVLGGVSDAIWVQIQLSVGTEGDTAKFEKCVVWTAAVPTDGPYPCKLLLDGSVPILSQPILPSQCDLTGPLTCSIEITLRV